MVACYACKVNKNLFCSHGRKWIPCQEHYNDREKAKNYVFRWNVQCVLFTGIMYFSVAEICPRCELLVKRNWFFPSEAKKANKDEKRTALMRRNMEKFCGTIQNTFNPHAFCTHPNPIEWNECHFFSSFGIVVVVSNHKVFLLIACDAWKWWIVSQIQPFIVASGLSIGKKELR